MHPQLDIRRGIGTVISYGIVPNGGIFTSPDQALPANDFAIKILVALDNWAGTNQSLFSKWNSTGNQQSFIANCSSDPALWLFRVSADGSTFPVGVTPARRSNKNFSWYWVGFSYDANNGGGSSAVSTWQAQATAQNVNNMDNVSWTLVSSDTATVDTVPFNSTALFGVGRQDDGGGASVGKFARAAFYGAFDVFGGTKGTPVMDFDPSRWTTGSTFTASTGEVWTAASGASFYRERIVL